MSVLHPRTPEPSPKALRDTSIHPIRRYAHTVTSSELSTRREWVGLPLAQLCARAHPRLPYLATWRMAIADKLDEDTATALDEVLTAAEAAQYAKVTGRQPAGPQLTPGEILRAEVIRDPKGVLRLISELLAQDDELAAAEVEPV
jgi:hypothetical protein